MYPPTPAPHRNVPPTPAPIPATITTPVPATAESGPCKNAKDYNGHKYLVPDGGGVWADAEAWARELKCCNVQGHLVTITSQAEDNFVATLLPPPLDGDILQVYWIGLHAPNILETSTNADFTWSDGEVYNWTAYTGFFGGAPQLYSAGINQDVCMARLNSTTHGWYNSDQYCGGQHGYVVEFNCTK